MPISRIIEALPFESLKSSPRVNLIRLHGSIGPQGRFDQRLNLPGLARELDAAFRLPGVAVGLLINSPGGAAVASFQIARRIRALAEEHNKPVFAFCEDVAASGGYILALAADEVFADPASLVGSIGVVSAGFGFTEAIDKLGVERRVYTAGRRKALLDPFRPENPEDVARLRTIHQDIHRIFKEFVRERRGDKLKGSDDELFEGLVWSGTEAHALGLVDGLGDHRSVLRARFGKALRFRLIEPRQPWWARRPGAGAVAALPERTLAALEERLLWSRYGL
ncbi:S49 family peptidase [Zavarzinia sp. CC-PAN008]|uniref:S49 family peptidase n=1 Tax=Zavarzinia sp. CC-PAN008 TaxID=3243332 RepID=UPI003F748701